MRAVRGESPAGELGGESPPPADGGRTATARGPRPAARWAGRGPAARGRGAPGTARSPRPAAARVEPSALVAEPGDQRRPRQLRHRPDLAQPEPGQSSADVEVRGQEAGRVRGEERGLVAGRDRDRGAGTGVDRGDGRREMRAGDPEPGARWRPSRSPGSAPRNAELTRSTSTGSGPHNGPEAVDPHLELPERGVARVATPRQARAERAERLERGLGRRPVRVGIGLDEGRLRDEPVGAPQRHAAPDAQRSSVRAASMTGPGSHGRPPSTSGPVGKGSERRARARWRGRCGTKRWRRRMVVGLSIGGLVRDDVDGWRDRGCLRGRRSGACRARGTRPARRPRRRGSAGSPVRPGGPWRLCATSASVRWPTTSRPRRTHDRRASSSRMPVDWSTAVARPPARARAHRGSGAGSPRAGRARRVDGVDRRSCAGLSVLASRPPGRSRTSMSTDLPGEQAPRDRQPLVQAGRGDDDEPFEPDAAGDGLDRVEAARQVEPGHDRALRLGLRGDPQGERRPAAGAVAADRDAGRLGEAAGSRGSRRARRSRCG